MSDDKRDGGECYGLIRAAKMAEYEAITDHIKILTPESALRILAKKLRRAAAEMQ